MRDTVKGHLKKSVPAFSDEDFIGWMQTQCGQIALTTVQIQFSCQVEFALVQELVVNQKLKAIGEKLRGNLDKLSSVIREDMRENKRNVIVALIITVVHQRDKLESLILRNVQTSHDFNWIWLVIMNINIVFNLIEIQCLQRREL